MDFGDTNKVHQEVGDALIDNAKLLEENMKAVDWRFFGKAYAYAMGAVLVTVFAFIVIIRLALKLF